MRVGKLAATTAVIVLLLGLILVVPGASFQEATRLSLVLAALCVIGMVLTIGTWSVLGVLPSQSAIGARIGAVPGLGIMWLVGIGEFAVSGHHVAILYMLLVWVSLVLGGAGVGAFVGLFVRLASGSPTDRQVTR